MVHLYWYTYVGMCVCVRTVCVYVVCVCVRRDSLCASTKEPVTEGVCCITQQSFPSHFTFWAWGVDLRERRYLCLHSVIRPNLQRARINAGKLISQWQSIRGSDEHDNLWTPIGTSEPFVFSCVVLKVIICVSTRKGSAYIPYLPMQPGEHVWKM